MHADGWGGGTVTMTIWLRRNNRKQKFSEEVTLTGRLGDGLREYSEETTQGTKEFKDYCKE